MTDRLYVGNLPYMFTESDLEQLFARHGTVLSIEVIVDRETGRSRGYAFVDLAGEGAAQAAILALDGKEVGGRMLAVREAKPPPGPPPRRRY